MMITKQTAYDIWMAYDEIDRGTKLLEEMREAQARYGSVDLKDAFGRRRGLQLGIPASDSGTHRLLDVAPAVAEQVVKAHIAAKQVELKKLEEKARHELGIFGQDHTQFLTHGRELQH